MTERALVRREEGGEEKGEDLESRGWVARYDMALFFRFLPLAFKDLRGLSIVMSMMPPHKVVVPFQFICDLPHHHIVSKGSLCNLGSASESVQLVLVRHHKRGS